MTQCKATESDCRSMICKGLYSFSSCGSFGVQCCAVFESGVPGGRTRSLPATMLRLLLMGAVMAERACHRKVSRLCVVKFLLRTHVECRSNVSARHCHVSIGIVSDM